jgi:DNA-binding transcriptional regulator LsrR (DeoR family)
MKESNTNMKDKIEWRRNKVNELSVKGFSQVDISRMLQISEPTISRDIEYLRQQANEIIRNHIQKKLPYEYTKCISGLEEIIKEGWIIATKADKLGNNKDKISSLALIKDTYNTKMDLLTNASLLQDSSLLK